jgi:hypothetical protein
MYMPVPRTPVQLSVVGPVVGAVALMMVPVVMVFAVMVMFAVVLTVVMAGRIVATVLGDGGSGSAYREGQGNEERCGYARYRLHFCLLLNEFGRDPKVPGPRVQGIRIPVC